MISVLLFFLGWLKSCSCQQETACSSEEQHCQLVADHLAHEECTLVQNTVRHRVFKHPTSMESGRQAIERKDEPMISQSAMTGEPALYSQQPTASQLLTTTQSTAGQESSSDQPATSHEPLNIQTPTSSQQFAGNEPLDTSLQSTTISLPATTGQLSSNSTTNQLPSNETTIELLSVEQGIANQMSMTVLYLKDFGEAATAAAEEITAIGCMPVSKTEVVSEIKRKASAVKEKAELVEASFQSVTEALANLSRPLSSLVAGLAFVNFTLFKAALGTLQGSISRLAASDETLLGILTFGTFSLVQGSVEAEPDICTLVKDTLDEAQIQHDRLALDLDVFGRLAENGTVIFADSTSQVKQQAAWFLSKAHEVVAEAQTSLLIAVKRFHDAVFNALAGKICASWKSSGFTVRPGFWIAALGFTIILQVCYRK